MAALLFLRECHDRRNTGERGSGDDCGDGFSEHARLPESVVPTLQDRRC
jgi:hypothetical protein